MLLCLTKVAPNSCGLKARCNGSTLESGRQDGAESYLLGKVGTLMKGSTNLIWKR